MNDSFSSIVQAKGCYQGGIVRMAPCRRSSSGSLAQFTVIRRASSRVSRSGRRAIRRSDTSGIGGEAEACCLRLKRC